MIKIVVENEEVKVKGGVSKRTGKEYTLREQRVIVYGVGRFPLETSLTLPDNVERYARGEYEVTTPLTVGRFGLDVSRDLGLVPVKAAAKAA